MKGAESSSGRCEGLCWGLDGLLARVYSACVCIPVSALNKAASMPTVFLLTKTLHSG